MGAKTIMQKNILLIVGFKDFNFVPYFLEKYKGRSSNHVSTDVNFDIGIVKTVDWYLEKYHC